MVRSCGRGGVIRTRDPIVPNDVRYQAALHPDQFQLYALGRASVKPNLPEFAGEPDVCAEEISLLRKGQA